MRGWLAHIDAADRRLDARLQAWAPPRWFRWCISGCCWLGDGWLWLALGAVLASQGASGRWTAVAALIAAAVSSTTMLLLKRGIQRRRPPGAPERPLFRIPSDRFSFPSGHAMNATAICTVLGLEVPQSLAWVGLVAVGIALSRLFARLHFASDVVAGSLLGVVIGIVTSLVLR